MKKSIVAVLVSFFSISAFSANNLITRRCSGIDDRGVRSDLFFYDGEVVTLIGGGTENMFAPLQSSHGSIKVFANQLKKITIDESKNSVLVETKFSSRVYSEVTCVSIGE